MSTTPPDNPPCVCGVAFDDHPTGWLGTLNNVWGQVFYCPGPFAQSVGTVGSPAAGVTVYTPIRPLTTPIANEA